MAPKLRPQGPRPAATSPFSFGSSQTNAPAASSPAFSFAAGSSTQPLSGNSFASQHTAFGSANLFFQQQPPQNQLPSLQTTSAADLANAARGKPPGYVSANSLALSQAAASITASSNSSSSSGWGSVAAVPNPAVAAVARIHDSAFASLSLFVSFPSIADLHLDEAALEAVLEHVDCSAEEIAQLHPVCVRFASASTPQPPAADWERVTHSESFVTALAALPRRELHWLLSQLGVELATIARLDRQDHEQLLAGCLCVAPVALQLQRDERALRRLDADSLMPHEQRLLGEQVQSMLRARRIDADPEELWILPPPADEDAEQDEKKDDEEQKTKQAASSSSSSSTAPALPFDGAMDRAGWMTLQSLADHSLVRSRGVSVVQVRAAVLASPWLLLSPDGLRARAKRQNELRASVNQLGMLSDRESLIASCIVGALATKIRTQPLFGSASSTLAVRLNGLLSHELSHYASRPAEVLSAARWSPSLSLSLAGVITVPASVPGFDGFVRWVNLDAEQRTRCALFTLMEDAGRPKTSASTAAAATTPTTAPASNPLFATASPFAPAASASDLSAARPGDAAASAAVVRSARYGFDPFWQDCTAQVQALVDQASRAFPAVSQLLRPSELGLTFPVKAGAAVQPTKSLQVQFAGWSESCTEHQFIDISPQRLNEKAAAHARAFGATPFSGFAASPFGAPVAAAPAAFGSGAVHSLARPSASLGNHECDRWRLYGVCEFGDNCQWTHTKHAAEAESQHVSATGADPNSHPQPLVDFGPFGDCYVSAATSAFGRTATENVRAMLRRMYNGEASPMSHPRSTYLWPDHPLPHPLTVTWADGTQSSMQKGAYFALHDQVMQAITKAKAEAAGGTIPITAAATAPATGSRFGNSIGSATAASSAAGAAFGLSFGSVFSSASPAANSSLGAASANLAALFPAVGTVDAPYLKWSDRFALCEETASANGSRVPFESMVLSVEPRMRGHYRYRQLLSEIGDASAFHLWTREGTIGETEVTTTIIPLSGKNRQQAEEVWRREFQMDTGIDWSQRHNAPTTPVEGAEWQWIRRPDESDVLAVAGAPESANHLKQPASPANPFAFSNAASTNTNLSATSSPLPVTPHPAPAAISSFHPSCSSFFVSSSPFTPLSGVQQQSRAISSSEVAPLYVVPVCSALDMEAEEQAYSKQKKESIKRSTVDDGECKEEPIAASSMGSASSASAASVTAAAVPSVSSSCSFSVRICAINRFQRLQIGFRQNSLFARTHLLTLAADTGEATKPQGHGEIVSRRNAKKLRTEMGPGDSLFEADDAETIPEPTALGVAAFSASSSSANSSASSSTPVADMPPSGRACAVPGLRVGSVLTCRYDRSRDEIRFSCNGAELPDATIRSVLTRHAQPAGWDVSALHAMLPVLLLRGSSIEVECVAEEEGAKEAKRIAEKETEAEGKANASASALTVPSFGPSSLSASTRGSSSSASFSLSLSGSPLRDLSGDLALLRLSERAVSGSSSSERDHHAEQTALVECPAAVIPAYLRLLMHDWPMSRALGLPYFPLAILDVMAGYIHRSAPQLGSRGFSFMRCWAPQLRGQVQPPADSRLSAADKERTVAWMFEPRFPFASRQLARVGALAMLDATDDPIRSVYHSLSMSGEKAVAAAQRQAQQETQEPQSLFVSPAAMEKTPASEADESCALWTRFADRHPDQIRAEDYDALQIEADEDAKATLEMIAEERREEDASPSPPTLFPAAESLDSREVRKSAARRSVLTHARSSPPVIRDEDGAVVLSARPPPPAQPSSGKRAVDPCHPVALADVLNNYDVTVGVKAPGEPPQYVHLQLLCSADRFMVWSHLRTESQSVARRMEFDGSSRQEAVQAFERCYLTVTGTPWASSLRAQPVQPALPGSGEFSSGALAAAVAPGGDRAFGSSTATFSSTPFGSPTASALSSASSFAGALSSHPLSAMAGSVTSVVSAPSRAGTRWCLFSPLIESYIMIDAGRKTEHKTFFQSITLMTEYEQFSFEELRDQDEKIGLSEPVVPTGQPPVQWSAYQAPSSGFFSPQSVPLGVAAPSVPSSVAGFGNQFRSAAPASAAAFGGGFCFAAPAAAVAAAAAASACEGSAFGSSGSSDPLLLNGDPTSSLLSNEPQPQPQPAGAAAPGAASLFWSIASPAFAFGLPTPSSSTTTASPASFGFGSTQPAVHSTAAPPASFSGFGSSSPAPASSFGSSSAAPPAATVGGVDGASSGSTAQATAATPALGGFSSATATAPAQPSAPTSRSFASSSSASSFSRPHPPPQPTVDFSESGDCFVFAAEIDLEQSLTEELRTMLRRMYNAQAPLTGPTDLHPDRPLSHPLNVTWADGAETAFKKGECIQLHHRVGESIIIHKAQIKERAEAAAAAAAAAAAPAPPAADAAPLVVTVTPPAAAAAPVAPAVAAPLAFAAPFSASEEEDAAMWLHSLLSPISPAAGSAP